LFRFLSSTAWEFKFGRGVVGFLDDPLRTSLRRFCVEDVVLQGEFMTVRYLDGGGRDIVRRDCCKGLPWTLTKVSYVLFLSDLA
jgi:hypothetical protein